MTGEAGVRESDGGVERERLPLSITPALHHAALTSVIVRVADSVTESSSGKFITETPQTSGTGLLPAG